MVISDVVNVWGHKSAQAAYREVAIILLSGVLVLLSIAVLWVVTRERPIYYVPMGGPGIAHAGVIPDDVVVAYATEWLETRYTFQPATVKAKHARILQSLHPRLTVRFPVQAEQEAAMVKEVKLSSQLTVLEAVVYLSTPQAPLRVQMTARRTLWIGGQEVRDEAVQAEII